MGCRQWVDRSSRVRLAPQVPRALPRVLPAQPVANVAHVLTMPARSSASRIAALNATRPTSSPAAIAWRRHCRWCAKRSTEVLRTTSGSTLDGDGDPPLPASSSQIIYLAPARPDSSGLIIAWLATQLEVHFVLAPGGWVVRCCVIDADDRQRPVRGIVVAHRPMVSRAASVTWKLGRAGAAGLDSGVSRGSGPGPPTVSHSIVRREPDLGDTDASGRGQPNHCSIHARRYGCGGAMTTTRGPGTRTGLQVQHLFAGR